MSDYKLIAFDMDETLLNSKKEITPGVIKAMEEAVAAGKIVSISTGRSVAELMEYKDIIPGLRYVSCSSGGVIFDYKNDKTLHRDTMSVETVLRIFEILDTEDSTSQFLYEECDVDKHYFENLEHYHMERYRHLYKTTASIIEDLRNTYRKNPVPMVKINTYFHEVEARDKCFEQIIKEGIPVTMAKAEAAGFEIQPVGTDKGSGIMHLGRVLGIPVEEIIAVGDADNDVPAIVTAGLGVAVGNAKDIAKKAADVIVADCDHDGAAEAIYKYLI